MMKTATANDAIDLLDCDEGEPGGAAEQTLDELKQELEAKSTELALSEKKIGELLQQQALDARLIERGVIDLEAARLLAAQVNADDCDDPDQLDDVVDELARQTPYLFHRMDGPAQNGTATGGAMGPRIETSPSPALRLEHAATEAGASGKRQDLMRYLRMRRGRDAN